MTAITIAVISTAYANLIEVLPGGGGGTSSRRKLLGKSRRRGSGCARLVDYV